MTQAEVDYDYEALPENAPLTACLLAGAIAGVAEHAVMYPVDSIKVNIPLLALSSSPSLVSLGILHPDRDKLVGKIRKACSSNSNNNHRSYRQSVSQSSYPVNSRQNLFISHLFCLSASDMLPTDHFDKG
jgi:hypothetical protein